MVCSMHILPRPPGWADGTGNEGEMVDTCEVNQRQDTKSYAKWVWVNDVKVELLFFFSLCVN